MPEILISVIIPHHHDESTLPLAVQSAVTQSLQPLEILVVNDDHQPLSMELTRRLKALADYVRIIELGSCSGGPANPRNIAVDQARASYVAFLDADDLWFSNHLEHLANIWRRSPHAIVHGHQLCWGESMKRPFLQAGLRTRSNPQLTFHQLLRFGNTVFMSSVGAPRDLIQRYRFDLELLWEDFDLWLRLAANGHVFINTNSYSTLYRIHQGSRSGSRETRRLAAQQLIDKYFKRRPCFLLPLWLLRNLYS